MKYFRSGNRQVGALIEGALALLTMLFVVYNIAKAARS